MGECVRSVCGPCAIDTKLDSGAVESGLARISWRCKGPLALDSGGLGFDRDTEEAGRVLKEAEEERRNRWNVR